MPQHGRPPCNRSSQAKPRLSRHSTGIHGAVLGSSTAALRTILPTHLSEPSKYPPLSNTLSPCATANRACPGAAWDVPLPLLPPMLPPLLAEGGAPAEPGAAQEPASGRGGRGSGSRLAAEASGSRLLLKVKAPRSGRLAASHRPVLTARERQWQDGRREVGRLAFQNL